MAKKMTPRGIRNNNPLNIRIGNTWLGEVDHPDDAAFEQFISMKYGIRAAFIILRRYIRRYGKNTVRSIVSTWAPPVENHTESYISQVANWMNLAETTPIDYSDKQTMCLLVQGMARVEVGEVLPIKVIEQGYDMA